MNSLVTYSYYTKHYESTLNQKCDNDNAKKAQGNANLLKQVVFKNRHSKNTLF